MTAIELSRRQALVLALGWSVGHAAWAAGPVARPLLLSARDTLDGNHWATGYDLDGTQRFSLKTDQRCHDIVSHPGGRQALFVARRPGTRCYWIDTVRGQVLGVLDARPMRHFYGHGVFDAEGRFLYLTENDLRQPGRGVIGVYRLQQQQFVFEREFDTHGIEPHQLEWDRERQGLFTANGGLITEANSREVRNAEAIVSSLVHVDLDGQLISHDSLADSRCSIRHLSVQPDGGVVTAQQFVGDPLMVESPVPLLAVKPVGKALQAMPMPAEQFVRLQGYLASIAVHPSQPWLATTAPRGNRFLIYDRTTLACIADAHMADCAGIVAWKDGFLLSSGQGLCRYIEPRAGGIRVTPLPLPAGGWDNHLRLV